MPQSNRPQFGTPDSRLGVRLAFSGAAVFLVAVPLTFLWVLVVSKAEWLERLDRDVATGLTDAVRESPGIDRALQFLSEATSPWWLRLLALAVGVLLWVKSSRRLATWLVVTMAIGGVLGLLLKLVVGRARPLMDEPIATAGGYSFPSGHALNSMLFAAAMLVLAYTFLSRPLRVMVWVAALALVLVTGFDRIGLGVHYVSDVLAGWAVGLATVLATTAAFDAWRRIEHAHEPELMKPPDDDPEASHPVRDALQSHIFEGTDR